MSLIFFPRSAAGQGQSMDWEETQSVCMKFIPGPALLGCRRIHLRSNSSFPCADRRNHVTSGWGTPVALQTRTTVSPSWTVTSLLESSSIIWAGTARRQNKVWYRCRIHVHVMAAQNRVLKIILHSPLPMQIRRNKKISMQDVCISWEFCPEWNTLWFVLQHKQHEQHPPHNDEWHLDHCTQGMSKALQSDAIVICLLPAASLGIYHQSTTLS